MPRAPAGRAVPRADFRVDYNGLTATLTPLTDACRAWLEDNEEIEPWQRLGDAIVVDPRYAPILVDAMLQVGLAEAG